MEELPIEYTEHNLPLVLLSGLINEDDQTLGAGARSRQESGARISSERPNCQGNRAKLLLEQLLSWDGAQQPWNSLSLPGPTGQLKYRLKTIGRSYSLPPRKAAPVAQSPSSETLPVRQISSELHSPLSPLSPGSPIFPDGVMTPAWFTKHQYQVPCLMIVFFDFTHSGGSAEDDLTKSEINAVKTALGRSGFRTRFATVLISDRSIIQAPEMEERLASIRRATSLDAKTGLFFMPPMPSGSEVASFVLSLLTTLQPVCIEYYRELTKHARRKKSRNTTPASPSLPMHGAAQSLSTPGWNARYEIKQAVFAEYRQEMDVAERHYSQAIEDLCNAEGVFETMPSWSRRWDETRLLCDSLAVRVIRCLLWNGLTTTAVQHWFEYRSRLKSLIDRKGKGTHTYGWLAWETRWTRIMAQLVQLAELPMLDKVARSKNEPPVDLTEFFAYARADKAFQSIDTVPPFMLLHHPGYWNRLALKKARARYVSALAIPDDDRIPPGQSPASSVANRAQSYDTYLVPEPHEEFANAQNIGMVGHLQLVQLTEQAQSEYLNKGQRRMMEVLILELAKDLAEEGMYTRAMDILFPLWDACTWREERWHNLFAQLLMLLNRCSIAVKDAEIAIATAWELSSLARQADNAHEDDMHRTIGELDLPKAATVIVDYQNTERLSPVRLSFAFDESQAFAGEPVKCQLALHSTACTGAASIQISEIKISIPGLQNIIIEPANQDAESNEEVVVDVSLEEQDDCLVGSVPLDLVPAQLRVVNFTATFQDAGPFNLSQVTIKFKIGNVQILHRINNPALLHAAVIYTATAGEVNTEDTRQESTTHIVVQPKPPKVEIHLKNSQKQYYVGEPLRLMFELWNKEARNVSGTITQTITQTDDVVVPSRLSSTDANDASNGQVKLAVMASHEAQLLVDRLDATSQLRISITFSYSLEDGAQQNTLTKTIETVVAVVPLLEVRWTFGPLLNNTPWPNYFDPAHEDAFESPSGIQQRWKAAFSAQTVAEDPVVIHQATIRVEHELDDAICSATELESEPQMLSKGGTLRRAFELTTQKISADDRRPIHLNLTCHVDWSHKGDSTINTSAISVPRINLPSSEPRVLCTVTQTQDSSSHQVILQYHLENLSTHFLTFAVTMDPSDSFAFSGAKYRTLSLAPLSRTSLSYRLMLHAMLDAREDGRWIWPNLQVVDSYYQKTLRIQPAGSDVKLDAQNGIGVFVRKYVQGLDNNMKAGA